MTGTLVGAILAMGSRVVDPISALISRLILSLGRATCAGGLCCLRIVVTGTPCAAKYIIRVAVAGWRAWEDLCWAGYQRVRTMVRACSAATNLVAGIVVKWMVRLVVKGWSVWKNLCWAGYQRAGRMVRAVSAATNLAVGFVAEWIVRLVVKGWRAWKNLCWAGYQRAGRMVRAFSAATNLAVGFVAEWIVGLVVKGWRAWKDLCWAGYQRVGTMVRACRISVALGYVSRSILAVRRTGSTVAFTLLRGGKAHVKSRSKFGSTVDRRDKFDCVNKPVGRIMWMAATSPIRLVARVLLRLQQCNYRSRPPTDIQSATSWR